MRLSFLALAAVAIFTSAPSHAAQLTYASPAVLNTDTGGQLTTAAVSLHFDPSQTASKETDAFGGASFVFENAVDLMIAVNSVSVSFLDLDVTTNIFNELTFLDGPDTVLRVGDPDFAFFPYGNDDFSLGEIVSPLTAPGRFSLVNLQNLTNVGPFNQIIFPESFGHFVPGTLPIPLPAGFVLLASGLGVLGVRRSLLNRR